MKKLIIVVMCLGMLVPTLGWANAYDDCKEGYIQAVDKNVQLQAQCDEEMAAQQKATRDKVAVGVAVGAVIASGGTVPVAIGVWKVISLPFVLLGF